jgi:hypothetical protein
MFTGPMSYDIYLVVWRYGKAIPGSGLHRETEDGHPIHQRIGIFAPPSYLQADDTYNVSDSNDVSEGLRANTLTDIRPTGQRLTGVWWTRQR